MSKCIDFIRLQTRLVFVILLFSGCGLNFTANPYKQAEELAPRPPAPQPNPLTTDKAVVSTHTSIEPLNLMLVNLHCNPNDKGEGGSEFVIPIHSVAEVLANLALEADKIPHTALVFSRSVKATVNGSSQDRSLVDMIPVSVFLMLRDMVGADKIESIQHLVQFFALTTPTEVFLYLMEQHSMPQLDDPAIYARNWMLFLNYLAEAGIKKHLLTPQETTRELQTWGASDEVISKLLAFVTLTEANSAPNAGFSVVFVSADRCIYNFPMKIVLPSPSSGGRQIQRIVRVHEPGEIITNFSERIHINIKAGPAPCPW